MKNLKNIFLVFAFAVVLGLPSVAYAHTQYCPHLGTSSTGASGEYIMPHNPLVSDVSGSTTDAHDQNYPSDINTNPAAGTTGEHGHLGCSPSTAAGFIKILDRVFAAGSVILFAIASIFILYAAFLYVTSQGEAEKFRQAKKVIMYAVLGIIAAAIAYGLPKVVLNFIS